MRLVRILVLYINQIMFTVVTLDCSVSVFYGLQKKESLILKHYIWPADTGRNHVDNRDSDPADRRNAK